MSRLRQAFSNMNAGTVNAPAQAPPTTPKPADWNFGDRDFSKSDGTEAVIVSMDNYVIPAQVQYCTGPECDFPEQYYKPFTPYIAEPEKIIKVGCPCGGNK